MPTSALYILTIFVWGASWIAIKMQVGDVAPQMSVFYRFAIAAVILLGYCLVRGVRLRYGPRDHARFAFLGLFLFNLNFLFVYYGTAELTSGLVSVLFSSVQIFNMILGYLVLRDRASFPMILGAITGILGIALVFTPEFSRVEISEGVLRGVGFTLMGTLSASVGMIASARFQKQQYPVLQTNAWGMSWSVFWMFLFILASGTTFSFDWGPHYVGSLAWLSLGATVLGFGLFLTLVGRVGAARASYAMVMFPLVALFISTLFENYQWTAIAGVGVVLALLGNFLVMGRKRS